MFAFRQILRAAPPPPAAAAKMAVGTNMIDNRLYKTVDQIFRQTRIGGLYSRMSFIHKYKTSTLTPFMNLL